LLCLVTVLLMVRSIKRKCQHVNLYVSKRHRRQPATSLAGGWLSLQTLCNFLTCPDDDVVLLAARPVQQERPGVGVRSMSAAIVGDLPAKKLQSNTE
jgi:hypothetical protein